MGVDEFGRALPATTNSHRRFSPSPPRTTTTTTTTSFTKRRHESTPPPPSSPPPRRHQPHRVERYVTEPMLCEFLYKERPKHVTTTARTGPSTVENEENNKEEKETNPHSGDETILSYDDYRKTYALDYIRTFFNEHMDDSWFRNRYAPLLKRRLLEDELERAASEAKAMMELMTTNQTSTIESARLGHGIKTGTNTLPTLHTFACSSRVIQLLDIPPHVSEEQILLALGTPARLYSGAVSPTTLLRNAVAVVSTSDMKDQVLAHIAKHVDTVVPRKDHTGPKTLTLTVECSDPYGRQEVMGQMVPTRTATLLVSTEPISTTLTVLSASLSSKTRIIQDKTAAMMIGRALDVKRKIPRNSRLEDLIDQLPPDSSDEDGLDVAIAYLRRVHLFSFYNGCTFGDSFINVIQGQGAAGGVQLRLKGADEFLQTNSNSFTDSGDKVDMLVKRLDDAIQKAVEATSDWVNTEFLMSESLDKQANESEVLEQQKQREWVSQHIIIDGEEGRARCGFQFCKKLFKDGSFLRKHLLKKHSEYLRAEVATCHDAFMMQVWDEEEIRPIPSVLVDCGTNFGLQPSPVLGAIPIVADPEPELWRREELRLQQLHEEEEQRQQRHRAPSTGGVGEDGHVPPRRNHIFVDVDDMQEEKVELKFDTVEIPVDPPKKKKRKKLL